MRVVTFGREPWAHECRRHYVREPLQHLTWPTMARGVRDLLNRFAEQDGKVVSAEGWVERLTRALGAHEGELDRVRDALGLLVREGFLEVADGVVRVSAVLASQACTAREVQTNEAARRAVDDDGREPARGRQTSTERVRRHRARKRALAACLESKPCTATVRCQGRVFLAFVTNPVVCSPLPDWLCSRAKGSG